MGCAVNKTATKVPDTITKEASSGTSLDKPVKKLEHPDSSNETKANGKASETIQVHVSMMSGEAYTTFVDPAGKLSDIHVANFERWGYPPVVQRILFGTKPLLDVTSTLLEFGIADGAVLTLLISEPLGQHHLQTPSGKKGRINQGFGKPAEALNEFELESWQTALRGDQANGGIWNYNYDPDEDGFAWGNIGAGGVDFYWTTRPDGCRYEYWSTDPGDNEYGILVRIDGTSMRAIGSGSDDGLRLYNDCLDEFQNDEVWEQLVEEGWPRPKAWLVDEESEEDEEDEEEDEEEEEEDRG